jgi:outer membrane protein
MRVRGLGIIVLAAAAAGGVPADPARAEDLMELYARAREMDPVFLAARYEQGIAAERLRESRAGALPAVSATASAARVRQDIRSSDNPLFVEGVTDFYDTDYALSVTQPLYRSEVLRRIPQAEAEVRLAEARFAAAGLDLMFRLAQAYFNVLAAADNLEFAVAERTAIRRQLEETEQRLGSGLARITDAHDARSRYALAEAAEVEAQDLLEERRRALAEITGAPPERPKVLSERHPLAGPQWPEVGSWLEAAMFRNPAIKAREAAVEIAGREVARQRGARLPTLDFVASYRSTDSGGTVFGAGNEIGTTDLSLRLAIPILDSGRIAALAEAASLRHRVALQELELEKRKVEREIRAAFRGVQSGATRAEALGKTVFSQSAALAAKEEGLRAGLETGVAVLDARRDLYRARRDLAQAHYIYILDTLKLRQTAGLLSVEDLEGINAYLQ